MLNVWRSKLKKIVQAERLKQSEKQIASYLASLNADQASDYIKKMVSAAAEGRDPEASLRFLLSLDKKLYLLQSTKAIEYGKGKHPKHRFIRYADFFVQHIEDGQQVLEVGSGKGYLSHAVASARPASNVFGVELSESRVKKAQDAYPLSNLMFIHSDIEVYNPNKVFDVLILSNILEHIENRTGFLKKMMNQFRPSKILLRVPQYDRDWRMPMKDEIGIDSLYPGHYIEYTKDSFVSELKAAGIRCERMEFKWGEILAVASPIY